MPNGDQGNGHDLSVEAPKESQGDKPDLAVLFDRYDRKMRRALLRSIFDENPSKAIAGHSAEDAVQETFCRVGEDGIPEDAWGHLEAWLIRSAKSRGWDAGRQAAREQVPQDETLVERYAVQEADESLSRYIQERAQALQRRRVYRRIKANFKHLTPSSVPPSTISTKAAAGNGSPARWELLNRK